MRCCRTFVHLQYISTADNTLASRDVNVRKIPGTTKHKHHVKRMQHFDNLVVSSSCKLLGRLPGKLKTRKCNGI